MAGMAAEEPQRKKPRPARLDEAARDAVDDDQYATNRREQLKKAPAENKADDGEGVSYVDGRAVVDRSQKKRIAKLAPADHRRSYDNVESCFIPGGLRPGTPMAATRRPSPARRRRRPAVPLSRRRPSRPCSARHLRRAGC